MTASRRQDVPTENTNLRSGAIAKHGWELFSCHSDAISQQVVALAFRLGTLVQGRYGSSVEVLSPSPEASAHPSSLSASYGLGPLPLHVDTSHLPVPARYLVLGCVNPGKQRVPTLVFDRYDLSLSSNQMRLLRSAVFHVQNGRRSFYGSIQGLNPAFIRFDPGCMKPVTQEAEEALALFSFEAINEHVQEIFLRAGDIMVIDNWRMLHGRAAVPQLDSYRSLIRCTVA